jgi:catechol 2,3-dioxygenase-like lactoylglutathione lyase family enzyme
MSPPRLFRVILPVADIEAATDFYRRLLGLQGERVSRGRHYFDCGGTIAVCFEPRADGDDFDAAPNTGYVYFAVDDLEATFERARSAGCEWLEAEPAERSWGERSFYARDPFGNPICFVDGRTIFTGSR